MISQLMIIGDYYHDDADTIKLDISRISSFLYRHTPTAEQHTISLRFLWYDVWGGAGEAVNMLDDGIGDSRW